MATFSISSTLNVERISFFVLMLIYPIIGYYIDIRFSNKKLVRLIFFHTALFPLIVYYNQSIAF